MGQNSSKVPYWLVKTLWTKPWYVQPGPVLIYALWGVTTLAACDALLRRNSLASKDAVAAFMGVFVYVAAVVEYALLHTRIRTRMTSGEGLVADVVLSISMLYVLQLGSAVSSVFFWVAAFAG